MYTFCYIMQGLHVGACTRAVSREAARGLEETETNET
jgi:hypothetical protein